MSAAGHDLVLASRSAHELEAVAAECREEGADSLIVPTDLRLADHVQRLVAATAEFGPVATLVNNSGVAGPSGMLWDLDQAGWEETMAVNVTGVFLTCRGFLPAMIERGRGSIVNIGSITGKRPLLGRTPYATSKLALVGLTRTLALEVGQFGIRVNLVSPGFVEGPRIEWVIERQSQSRGVEPSMVRSEFAGHSPLGRLTSPAEVAAAVVFLASEAASGITGADINVNAGAVMY